MAKGNMSIKETIRQEIESRMKICEGIFERESDTYYQGKAVAYGELLAFIDSLSEGKPSYVTDSPGDPGNPGEPGISDDLEEAVFKELGTTKDEYLAKSMDKVHLEMEIATYLQDWDDDDEIGLHLSTDNGSIPIELEDIRDLARHFANWQKEQMMKEAVEGVVYRYESYQRIATAIIVDIPREILGNKVKIIIVKEEVKNQK